MKGLNILLKSFKNIKSSKISLHIYGPKGDFDVNNFISENILYHGIFPFSEINSILKKYDVLCLPSISYEMMPLVIQEAINNGLYIIGSDVPGIMELVNQETNGVIVERNNVASLTQALIDLEINYRRNDNFTIESFRSISDRILKENEIVVSDN